MTIQHATTIRTPEGEVPLLGEPWTVELPDGRRFAKDPSVIRFGDRYLMYFSLPPFEQGAQEGWQVGIAQSDDLRTWEQVGALPPAPGVEARGLAAPGAVVIGERVHLFYQSYGNGPRDAICHAVSEDGVTFERDPGNPVFRPQGEWSCGRAIDADMLIDGDRLLMAWATRDPDMKVQMLGMASAPLDSALGAGDWTDLSLDGPALRPELDWERDCIEAPALCRAGDRMIMFYAGAYNNEPQQIGWAYSSDGVRWTRGSDTPIIPSGAPGDWNSSESGHPGMLTDADGRTYLFLQGNAEMGHSNLLAGLEVHWDGETPVLRG